MCKAKNPAQYVNSEGLVRRVVGQAARESERAREREREREAGERGERETTGYDPFDREKLVLGTTYLHLSLRFPCAFGFLVSRGRANILRLIVWPIII